MGIHLDLHLELICVDLHEVLLEFFLADVLGQGLKLLQRGLHFGAKFLGTLLRGLLLGLLEVIVRNLSEVVDSQSVLWPHDLRFAIDRYHPLIPLHLHHLFLNYLLKNRLILRYFFLHHGWVYWDLLRLDLAVEELRGFKEQVAGTAGVYFRLIEQPGSVGV